MNIKELAKTIKHLEINTSRHVNEMFAGNYKSSFKGQGLEVSDHRKYEEGDDARHIDWIITARQGSPYIKKFQETRELTTVLLVDISDSMKFTSQEKTKARIAIETSACLLFSALKSNDKFGAIIFADKIYAYIPPKKGRSHLLRVLREIIQGFDDVKRKKTNLKIALDFLNKTSKSNSICFLLSDSVGDLKRDESRDIRSLKISNKKFDFVYFNIFDNFEKKISTDYPNIKIINPETGETEIINLKNKKIIKKYNKLRFEKFRREEDFLNKNKIDFLLISTTSNIYKKLLLFFKRRALKY